MFERGASSALQTTEAHGAAMHSGHVHASLSWRFSWGVLCEQDVGLQK